MSYQALYRKWRPKTFDDVKGQDAVCTALKNQIISGRIGHAYLFCGTRGTGKTSVAKIFARAVNCLFPNEGSPCNNCEICQEILSESSLNVVEIDAASNNGVDNIRDIKQQVQYPPTRGKYRVFIIDEVHMLSTGAFNALLKTLEEPPEYVIFILATTEAAKVPVTVLSRCQRYDFKRISVEVISDRLKELTEQEQIAIDEKALYYIARRADGALRDALSLLDECTAFQGSDRTSAISYEQVLEILGVADIKIWSDLFEAIAGADIEGALKILSQALLEGKELTMFVNDYLWFLRNLLIIKTAGETEGIVDGSREDIKHMQDDASHVSAEALMRYIRIFAQLSNQIRYSSQKRVLTELAIIKLSSPQNEENLDSVLERVSKLEAKLQLIEENGPTPSVANTGKKTGADPEQAKKKKDAAAVEKTVLPKAQYDDLMLLRREWGKILSGLSGATASIYKDTVPEPKSEGVIMLTFSDTELFKLASRATELKKLSDYVSNTYGKSFEFKAGIANPDRRQSVYVSEEEIKDKIKFDITSES